MSKIFYMCKFLIFLLLFLPSASSCFEAKPNSENLAFPNDENGDVLRLLQSKGFDFSSEHIFDYEHIFQEKESAQKFSDEVEKQNMKTEINYFSKIPNWNVTVKVKHLPTYDKITNTEMELEKIAKKFGGKKDVWGVLQTPK